MAPLHAPESTPRARPWPIHGAPRPGRPLRGPGRGDPGPPATHRGQAGSSGRRPRRAAGQQGLAGGPVVRPHHPVADTPAQRTPTSVADGTYRCHKISPGGQLMSVGTLFVRGGKDSLAGMPAGWTIGSIAPLPRDSRGSLVVALDYRSANGFNDRLDCVAPKTAPSGPGRQGRSARRWFGSAAATRSNGTAARPACSHFGQSGVLHSSVLAQTCSASPMSAKTQREHRCVAELCPMPMPTSSPAGARGARWSQSHSWQDATR